MLSIFHQKITYNARKGKFLKMPGLVTEDWVGSDTKELYEENLKKQPTDWEFRKEKVIYQLNQHRYRTEEFEKIDWGRSIVIFGCSQVFGVGLNDNDIISSHISNILQVPVINMGAPGTSNTFALHNSCILSENYPPPLAVIHMWSGVDRMVYYCPYHIESYGPWNLESSNFYDLWSKDSSNPEMTTIFASKIAKQIWQQKTKFFEITAFKDTAKLLGCDQLVDHDPDFARDLIHFGKKTTKYYSELIALSLSQILKK